jgi:hypothetical protein
VAARVLAARGVTLKAARARVVHGPPPDVA